MNRRDFLTFNRKKANTTARPSATQTKQQTRRNSNLDTKQQAARFLMQATFGPTMADIDHVTAIGHEKWIEEQSALPASETLKYMWDEINPIYWVEDVPLLGIPPFRWAWWQMAMRGADQLRQRIAVAFSEIMVISTKTDLLEDTSTAVASYYDTLLKHALGNFRDLLYDVATHPAMGYYLSHASNRKADPSVNRYPDENFAREVMQLFSIGLFELNLDGTRKKDSNGQDIPTYNNDDIKEFAKIFTGMTYQTAEAWEEEEIDITTEEGFTQAELNWENGQLPMIMYEQYHSQGEKRLLNQFVVPAGQSGLKDVNDAIDNLFHHPNVAPFISRLLIQRLVKSSPSPAYISRVAQVFNNNGRGVRGDLQAVTKAILLDDEARNTAFITDPTHGMLREPFVRYVHLCRALEVHNRNGEEKFYNIAEELEGELGQHPFASPSVFNFFSPDYRPQGSLSAAGLSAPEFQITTSVTTIRLFNLFEALIFDDSYMEVPEGMDEEDALEEQEEEQKMPSLSEVIMNSTPYDAVEGDIAALIARLNLLFAYGSLSSATLDVITTAAQRAYQEGEDEWVDAVRLAILLTVTNPESVILK